jgi:hypothetical protein
MGKRESGGRMGGVMRLSVEVLVARGTERRPMTSFVGSAEHLPNNRQVVKTL